MVNASLNWASIVGILLALYGLAAAPLSIAQTIFTLQKRADTSPAVIGKALFHVIPVGSFLSAEPSEVMPMAAHAGQSHNTSSATFVSVALTQGDVSTPA